MPGVHRIASLLKRWVLGTHQGSVTPDHLQSYLEANQLVHDVEGGEIVVVTRHGKPVAALRLCHEDDVEDFVLETSTTIRRSVIFGFIKPSASYHIGGMLLTL